MKIWLNQADEESESVITFLYLLFYSTSSSKASSNSPFSIFFNFLKISFFNSQRLFIFSTVVKLPSKISSWERKEVYELTWYLGNLIKIISAGLMPN